MSGFLDWAMTVAVSFAGLLLCANGILKVVRSLHDGTYEAWWRANGPKTFWLEVGSLILFGTGFAAFAIYVKVAK